MNPVSASSGGVPPQPLRRAASSRGGSSGGCDASGFERGQRSCVRREPQSPPVGEEDEKFVRRSVRDPSSALMERRDVKTLLDRIQENHSETVVLKIKDHILSDINSTVMDEIIVALRKNRVCQALYVQNLGKAIEDKQLKGLLDLLKKRPIWCLNIGETYGVTAVGWRHFCKALVDTSVTHLYVSEHTIDTELKNEMRSHIRENRKKHDKHCSLKNLRVIEKCTNMWW